MPWVKIDDHFDEHPKLAAVGPIGWGVWLAGLAYCNRNLTDGFIPYSIAEGIGGAWQVRVVADFTDSTGGLSTGEQIWHISRTSGMDGEDLDSQWAADLLVAYEVWDRVPGGYRVHDYDDYQPTKAEVLAERAKKQAAGSAGGKASAQARGQASAKAEPQAPAQAKSKPVPVPVPVPPSSSIEDSGVSARESSDEEDALVVYHSLTGRFPQGRVKDWLTELTAEFGDKFVGKALAVEVIADPAVHTLLSRTQERLRRAFHEADKQRAVKQAQAAEEQRREIEAMPPEQRAANLARLRDEMSKAGLLA